MTMKESNPLFRGYEEVTLPLSRFPHPLILYTVRACVGTYFRLQVYGLEHLPTPPMIIAANHQSYFDGFFLARTLPISFLRQVYMLIEKCVSGRYGTPSLAGECRHLPAQFVVRRNPAQWPETS